jgi:hypothetical protein
LVEEQVSFNVADKLCDVPAKIAVGDADSIDRRHRRALFQLRG